MRLTEEPSAGRTTMTLPGRSGPAWSTKTILILLAVIAAGVWALATPTLLAWVVALAVAGFGIWRLLHVRVVRHLLYHYASWFFALWFQGWLDGAVSALKPLLGQTPDPPSPPLDFSLFAEVALYATPVSVLIWFFVTRKDRLKRAQRTPGTERGVGV